MFENKQSNHDLNHLLQQKVTLFKQVEIITNDILEAPIEDINMLLETRGNVLEQVVQIDDYIKLQVEGDTQLKSILNGSCDMSALSGEQKELFEEALRIRAVVNRIIKNEDSIRLRIENERDSLLEKIETMNSSSKTVAESYKRSVETAIPQDFGSSRNKTV